MGLPSITALMSRFDQSQEYGTFVLLCKEYLPEREKEILALPGPTDQIGAFVSHFAARYFPLEEWFAEEAECYGDLTGSIPVVIWGMDFDDYHSIVDTDRPGLQLMTYLLNDPWGYEEIEGGDIRVPLAEACAAYVSRELLQRVPEGGMTRDEAHRFLDGTLYAELSQWADVLSHETGTYFLDASMEDAGYDQVYWERETVDELTQQWTRADEIQEGYLRLSSWLEEDPPARFAEILDFIQEKIEVERRANETQPEANAPAVGPA